MVINGRHINYSYIAPARGDPDRLAVRVMTDVCGWRPLTGVTARSSKYFTSSWDAADTTTSNTELNASTSPRRTLHTTTSANTLRDLYTAQSIDQSISNFCSGLTSCMLPPPGPVQMSQWYLNARISPVMRSCWKISGRKPAMKMTQSPQLITVVLQLHQKHTV